MNTDPNVTEFYVGSTKNIRRRKCQHKYSCNNENSEKNHLNVYKFIRKHQGFENWDMIVLEEVHYDKKHELRKYERDHIELLKPTLNKHMPDTLSIDNCGGLENLRTASKKKFYQENKEKIKYSSHQRYLILKEKITCECGGNFQKSGKHKHLQTKKHLLTFHKYALTSEDMEQIKAVYKSKFVVPKAVDLDEEIQRDEQPKQPKQPKTDFNELARLAKEGKIQLLADDTYFYQNAGYNIHHLKKGDVAKIKTYYGIAN
eukprot:gene3054-5225_t